MDLPASYSAAELSSIEACKRLVIEFASLIDANRTDELIHMLVPEATFARPTAPDTVVSGAQAIVQAFASRPKDLVTQHLNLNIRITLTGADTAIGESVVVLYRANGNDALEPGKGRQAAGPLLGTWSDTFVRTPQGWRFKDRRGRVTMFT